MPTTIRPRRSAITSPWRGRTDEVSIRMNRARRIWVWCEDNQVCDFCNTTGKVTYALVGGYGMTCCGRCTFGIFWLSTYESLEI